MPGRADMDRLAVAAAVAMAAVAVAVLPEKHWHMVDSEGTAERSLLHHTHCKTQIPFLLQLAKVELEQPKQHPLRLAELRLLAVF